MNYNLCKTTCLLFMAGMFACCAAQNNSGKKYSSLLRDGIKGTVAAAETLSFTIDTANRIARQDSCCITRTEYDKHGNSVKVGRFTIEGAYRGGTVTKYYRNGLIKQISFLNKDKQETAREEFVIDQNGNYTGGIAYDEGKLLRTFKITAQNEYGQWTRLNWYFPDGRIYREENYTYEGNKKVAEVWKEYKDDPNGKIVQDLTAQYNARGEMILQRGIHSFLGAVNEKSDRIFEYDKHGNWVQYIILNPSGKPLRMVKRNLIYR